MPQNFRNAGAGDATARWDEARFAEAERIRNTPAGRRMKDHEVMAQAICNLVESDPELHQAMLAAAPSDYARRVASKQRRSEQTVLRRYA
ncbi:MAG TPA: hypothetical protein VGY55_11760 [Pirellulales bacterium]|nr:hypothetical protein [Pirellulales bacterium]